MTKKTLVFIIILFIGFTVYSLNKNKKIPHENNTEQKTVLIDFLNEIQPGIIITDMTILQNILKEEHDWMSLYGLLQEKLNISSESLDILWQELTLKDTVKEWGKIIDDFLSNRDKTTNKGNFTNIYHDDSNNTLEVYYENNGTVAVIKTKNVSEKFTYVDESQLSYGKFINHDKTLFFFDYGDKVLVEKININQILFQGILN